MLRPRIIVSLLINNGRLVKTINFRSERYIGDPLNAVRIFNEKQCDELVIYDISASKNNLAPNYKLLEKIASVSNMPLCYGGGVRDIRTAEKLVHLGFEKVSVSRQFLKDSEIVRYMSAKLGSQSVVVTLNVTEQRKLLKTRYVLHKPFSDRSELLDPLEAAKLASNLGAGEIVFNSVLRDGSQKGFDLNFVRYVKDKISTPVTFLGGCGSLSDISELLAVYGRCGCAAGSQFIYKGKLNGILINYPKMEEKLKLMENKNV